MTHTYRVVGIDHEVCRTLLETGSLRAALMRADDAAPHWHSVEVLDDTDSGATVARRAMWLGDEGASSGAESGCE